MFSAEPFWQRKRLVVAVAALVALISSGLVAFQAPSANSATYNMSEECQGSKPDQFQAFKTFKFFVNDVEISQQRIKSDRIVDDITKNGDKIRVEFELKPECANTYVAINMFQAPEAKFVPSHAHLQKHAPGSPVDGVFKAGRDQDGKLHTLNAQIPKCYFQMDINTGRPYKPGDYSLDRKGRLLLAANGGTKKCAVASATTTTTEATTTTIAPTTTTTTEAVHASSATAKTICKAGDVNGWEVHYVNDGNVEEEMTLRSLNETLDTVMVDPGKSLTKSYSFSDHEVADGESIQMKVIVSGKVIATLEATNDCIQPEVAIVQDCAVDATGFDVTYSNNGAVDQELTLYVDGAVVDTVSVEAGEEPFRVGYKFDNERIQLAKGESAEIFVKVGEKVIATDTVSNDCVDSTVEVVGKCNTEKGSGAVFTFANNGRLTEQFNVFVGGGLVENSPVSVAPGRTSKQIVNLSEDVPVNFRITSEVSRLDTTKTVVVDCREAAPVVLDQPPTQVLGTQIERADEPEQLAATGMTTKSWLVTGIVLLLGGATLLVVRRRLTPLG